MSARAAGCRIRAFFPPPGITTKTRNRRYFAGFEAVNV
jgi:hypothetical protein